MTTGLAKEPLERQPRQPCKAMAARGATVCRVHGGSAPQVKAAAQRRIQNALDAAAKRLLGFAFDDGVTESIALQAVNGVLDRGGLGAKQAIGVEVETRPWEQLLRDITNPVQPVAQLSRRVHEALKRGELLPAPPAEVVDAELVDDAPEPQPEPHEERADAPGAPPNVSPPFADMSDPLGPMPSKELVTLEEANAEVNAVNRRARVVRSRRVR